MPKIERLLVPLTTIAALTVVLMLVMPNLASGEDRSGPAKIADDVYVFGRTATIDHAVKGNVQVYKGNVTVSDVIDGDLIVFGGSVIFVGAGRVTGNVIQAASSVKGADGRVGGRVVSLASMEGAAASITKRAIVVSLLLVWLVAAVIVTLMSGREVRLSSTEIRASALHCFALGLVALTSFVLTAIMFGYLVPYVIGIPLLAALAVFAILTKVFGMIAVFHAVGTLVAGARTREQLAARRWFRGDLAMVIVGLLILGIIRMIPGIGAIVWGVASVFGVGVSLATKFGRREPWFLQFRSAVA
ncbi:MAG TPA: hypothetical protein VMU84_10945 [Thermoanaerobaculia bacterium]|nr:hypothetical protein [Thermoanaerobaculia bacterium]